MITNAMPSRALSPTDQVLVDNAVADIYSISQQYDLDANTVIGIVQRTADARMMTDRQIDVIKGLIEGFLETYYGIEDFSMCSKYYDGCNECEVVDGMLGSCTERGCIRQDQPQCLQRNTADQKNLAELCAGDGGEWIAEARECEYMNQSNCQTSGGQYYECGSACRNDIDAEICTLQCVPYCARN
jgi:hypothetical protein